MFVKVEDIPLSLAEVLPNGIHLLLISQVCPLVDVFSDLVEPGTPQIRGRQINPANLLTPRITQAREIEPNETEMAAGVHQPSPPLE